MDTYVNNIITRQFAIVVTLLFNYGISMFAQNVRGTVRDASGRAMEFVSVTLRSIGDSTIADGTSTNADGTYTLAAQVGKTYQVAFTYVGYKTVVRECKGGDVVDAVMAEDVATLGEVRISSSRIEHNASGYIANVRSLETFKGKQVSEALQFLPNVTKDNDAYKINGLQVSEIRVNGEIIKGTGELKNISANMVERVKVEYFARNNQSASLSGGTLDIVLRNPPQGGYYGSLQGGLWVDRPYGFSSENVGGMFLYRNKGLNIYENLSIRAFQPEEKETQTLWDTATEYYSHIYNKVKTRGYRLTNRLSVKQIINDRQSLGGSYYLSSNKVKPHSSSTNTSENSVLSYVNRKTRYTDQEATLNYTARLNDKGASMEIIADYFNRHEDDDMRGCVDDATSATSSDETMYNLYKLSMDFMLPKSQKLVWKYGASAQYVTNKYTPNDMMTAKTDRFVMSNTSTKAEGLSPLIYAEAMGAFWKVQYNIGANWQLNSISYRVDGGDKSKDTKWGINPKVQMQMMLDKNGKHALMFSYKRSMDDIPYDAISSTIRWTDANNYTVGNLDLKAPTKDVVLLGANLFNSVFNVAAIYAHSKDNIYWETVRSDEQADVYYTRPINLSSMEAFGLSAELNVTPLKRWTMKMFGKWEVHPEDVTIGGTYYGDTRFRQYYSISNDFSFKRNWHGMLNLVLEPTYKDFDCTMHTVYNIDGQVSKSFKNDKYRLSLTFNAIGNRRKYDTQVGSRKITYDITSPVQSVGLSFVWNFSGGKRVNVETVEGIQDYKEIKNVK